MDENVTAIIPAYNEEENIRDTINSVLDIEEITEIIVVDDCSNDNTYKAAEDFADIILIHNDINIGKGGAIKAALPFVSNKYVIFIDADLKQSASEMKKLVTYIGKNDSTMLVAVYPRPLKKGGFGLVKLLSRKGLYILTSKTFDSVLSGQRLMSTEFIQNISLPNNFALEFKITLEALKNNLNIIEVPVNIRHRETGRNIIDFMHRGKQFIDILNALVREMM